MTSTRLRQMSVSVSMTETPEREQPPVVDPTQAPPPVQDPDVEPQPGPVIAAAWAGGCINYQALAALSRVA